VADFYRSETCDNLLKC